jgi:hypothetical protein
MTEIFDNIREIYNFNCPCQELSDYIEFFSESSFEETKKHFGNKCFSVRMFPSWTPTFYINLGTSYRLLMGNDSYIIKPKDDILILRGNIAERQNLPFDHIFTVKFFLEDLKLFLV